MMYSARTAIVAGMLILGMTGASFADVLFAGSRKDPSSGPDTTYTFVPLLDNNSVTVGFTTTAPNELVVVTYNAECRRGGSGGYVSVQIQVDGKAAHPRSGTNFAMCSSADRVAAVRQSFFVVKTPGSFHTVRVQAAAVAGATSWFLDDSSIVIEN